MPKANAKNYHFHKDIGICIFCNTGEEEGKYCGRLLTDKDETLSVHNYCLLFASGLSQNGKDKEGIDGFLLPDILEEYKRGRKLGCCYCSQRTTTIGCSGTMCRKGFHFNCGFKQEAMFLFFGTFLAYCKDHRPQQNVTIKASDPATVPCPICIEDVEAKVSNHTIKTPCCNNTWFHRACVQSQALSAGYFFRCAICNNQDQFQEEMKNFGIYIPEHDASWEQEDNAFQDLYWRHDTCDIEPCKYPDGKNFNKASSKWELVLCDICGSSGCHLACGGLQSPNQDWACAMCSAMLSNATEANCTSAGSPKKSPVAPKESPKMTGQTTRTAMKLMGKHPRTPLSSHLCRKKVMATSPQTSPKLSNSPVGFCSPIQDSSVPNLSEMLDCCRPSTSGQGKNNSKHKMNKKRKLSFSSKENYASTSPNMPESKPYKKHCTWKRKNADLRDYMKSTSKGLKYGPRTTLRMSMRPRNIPKQSSPSKSQGLKQTSYSSPKDAVKETWKTKTEVPFESSTITNSTIPVALSKEQPDSPEVEVLPPVCKKNISFSTDKSQLSTPKADNKSIKEVPTSILKRPLAKAKIEAASSKEEVCSPEFEVLPPACKATILFSPEKSQLCTQKSGSNPIQENTSSFLKTPLAEAKIETTSLNKEAGNPKFEVLPPTSRAIISSSPDKSQLLIPKSNSKPIKENPTKRPLGEVQINCGHSSKAPKNSCEDTDMSSADPDSSWCVWGGCEDFDSESANPTDSEDSVALLDKYIRSSECLDGLRRPRKNVETCLTAKQRDSLFLQVPVSDSSEKESPRSHAKRRLKKETEIVTPLTDVSDQLEQGYAGNTLTGLQKESAFCDRTLLHMECKHLFPREDDSLDEITSTKPKENNLQISESPDIQEKCQRSLDFSSNKKKKDKTTNPIQSKLNGISKKSSHCFSSPEKVKDVLEFETPKLTGTLSQGKASRSGEIVQQDTINNSSNQVKVSMLDVVDEELKGSTPEKTSTSLVSRECTTHLSDASGNANDKSEFLIVNIHVVSNSKCKHKDKSKANSNKNSNLKSGPRKNSMSLKKQKKTKTKNMKLKIKMNLTTPLDRREKKNGSNQKALDSELTHRPSKGSLGIHDPTCRKRVSSTPKTPTYLDGDKSVDLGSSGSATPSDGGGNRISTDQIGSLACSDWDMNLKPMDQVSNSPTNASYLDQNKSLDQLFSASAMLSDPDKNRLENEVPRAPITPSKQDKCSMSLDQVISPPATPNDWNRLVDHEVYSEPPTPSNWVGNRSSVDPISSAPATPNNRGKKRISLDMGQRRCSSRITLKQRHSKETEKKNPFIKQPITDNKKTTKSRNKEKKLNNFPKVKKSSSQKPTNSNEEPLIKDMPCNKDNPVSPRMKKSHVINKHRQTFCEEERPLVKGRYMYQESSETKSWLSGSLLRKSCSKHLAQKKSSQEHSNNADTKSSFKSNQEADQCSSKETFALLDRDDNDISFSKEYQSQSGKALDTLSAEGSLETTPNKGFFQNNIISLDNLPNETKGTPQSSPNLKDLCSRVETTSPDLFDSDVDTDTPFKETQKRNKNDGHGGVISDVCINHTYPDSLKSKINTKRKSMQRNKKYESTVGDDLKMDANGIGYTTRSTRRKANIDTDSNQVPLAAHSVDIKNNSPCSPSLLQQMPETPMTKPTQRTASWTFNCRRGNSSQEVNHCSEMPKSCPGKYQSGRSGDGEFEKPCRISSSYTEKHHSRVCAKLFRSWEEEKRHQKQF